MQLLQPRMANEYFIHVICLLNLVKIILENNV